VADAVQLTRIAVPPTDGGTTDDMGDGEDDAGAGVDQGPGRRPRSGCGCRVGGEDEGRIPLGLLGGLMVASLRHRRRRARR